MPRSPHDYDWTRLHVVIWDLRNDHAFLQVEVNRYASDPAFRDSFTFTVLSAENPDEQIAKATLRELHALTQWNPLPYLALFVIDREVAHEHDTLPAILPAGLFSRRGWLRYPDDSNSSSEILADLKDFLADLALAATEGELEPVTPEMLDGIALLPGDAPTHTPPVNFVAPNARPTKSSGTELADDGATPHALATGRAHLADLPDPVRPREASLSARPPSEAESPPSPTILAGVLFWGAVTPQRSEWRSLRSLAIDTLTSLHTQLDGDANLLLRGFLVGPGYWASPLSDLVDFGAAAPEASVSRIGLTEEAKRALRDLERDRAFLSQTHQLRPETALIVMGQDGVWASSVELSKLVALVAPHATVWHVSERAAQLLEDAGADPTTVLADVPEPARDLALALLRQLSGSVADESQE